MIPNFLLKNIYRTIFIVCSISIGLLMVFLSQDYGPLEDTKIHQDHGVRILNYFKGIDKIATLSPVDQNGNYIDVAVSQDHENRGMNGFGGFFDLVTNFLHQFFDTYNVYEFKNLINSIFGFLLFLFCGLLGKELGGWKSGVLTLLFVVLCPIFFGYSMNNPKDIPAAAFYMFSLFHIIKLLKELPRVSLKRSFFLILNISLLINIRVIGLMVIGYVLIAVFTWWLIENYVSGFKKIVIKDTIVLAVKVLVVCILSYFSVSVFWPYARTNPIKVPIEILFKMGEFRGFENMQLFEGDWKSSFDMPWYYAIKNLFIIMMPLHAFLGFFLIPLLYYKNTTRNMFYISMVLFASVFPMLLVILGKPNSHDGSRQFLFSVLPIVVISALSLFRLFQLLSHKNSSRIVVATLVFLMLQPLAFMIQYHPLQALYFSPIVGGVSGAFGTYEIDYYGVGVRPALDWLEEHVADATNPPRVRMYYGSQVKMDFREEKIDGLTFVKTRRHSLDWDYSIVLLAEGKYKKDHTNVNWSKDHTVHEIKVDEVVVCWILKNHHDIDRHISELQKELEEKPSASGFTHLGMLLHTEKDYLGSVASLKKSITLTPNNAIAFNNLCSVYNTLFMFDEAKAACEQALGIQSDMQLAKNNLRVSLNGINRRKNKDFTITEYNFISDNYYRVGDQEKSIATIIDLLEKDPTNAAAYNNLCASYTLLGAYEKAIEACQTAIELAPDFQLAKNNLKWAQQSLE